jgi:cell division protein FtsI/penicillin-binding protein 2
MLRETVSRRRIALLTCCLTSLAALAALSAHDRRTLAAPAALITAHGPDAPREKLRVTLDRVHRSGAGYVADLDGGARADLTLDPRMQRLAEKLLATHDGPYGTAVLVSVEDGRVLALAGRDRAHPDRPAPELALKPWAPAASVFKLVTAAALVERGVTPQTQVCYHDGVHALDGSNLTAHPRLDGECNNLSFAVAKSQNAIIARLAHEHLDGSALARAARALGFGEALGFDVAVAPSRFEAPAGGLELARAAAGFFHSTLSPLHGAWLAAVFARGGVAAPLRIVERLWRGEQRLPLGETEPRRVLDQETARTVGRMMVGTTRFGTARLGFHDRRGRALLPGIDVAGKTGTLNRVEKPFLGYSWFVGYAPAERPEVAVAVLLGNGAGQTARAHRVAGELLEGYFHKAPKLVARR